MECPSCNHQNRPDNDFCERCGTALGLKCDVCGRINHRNSRFCGQCGTALATPQLQGSSQPSQDLLRALSAKGGERKHLTVLFADVRDSTRLIDSLGDPEAGMRRLKPVLDLMMEAVHRYDGIVNKVQGDGVMALFGAPRPHEDHAVRGCLAALAMQEAVARLGDPGIQIRVGVHTDEVIVHTIDNSIYQTYDAAGAGVHLANRLEQMADGGGALISKATYVAARRYVEVESLGEQAVRGIAEPVEIFKLSGRQNAPVSRMFQSGRRLSRLIGRHDQLASLEKELQAASGGEGGVVGVVGEAGIGKSRLCFEFTDRCRRRGIRVFEARVLAHGGATPFQPALELLRDFFGVRIEDDPAVSRRRVLERLEAIAASDQSRLLLEFLGLADPTSAPLKLDPEVRKLGLLEFVRFLARVGGRDTATVVLIEDLHWIDLASEEFVEALADAVVGTRTLLIVNFRPGFSAALMQRSHYRQINMPNLGATDAHVLLQDQLGDDPSLALLGRNIVERAQGNPFFLEELVNVLVERGDFDGTRGAYRLKGGVETIPLPNTVQAVIAARIDRLDGPSKQLLETAAVIGREVPLSLLSQVAAMPEVDLSRALNQLRQSELLYEVPPFDQRIHAFRQPLIQEVSYRSLLSDRRRTLHASVAAAIAAMQSERGDEQAALLAYHLEQSGEALKAAQQHVRAAIWVGANDPAQALRSWKKVRELLVDLPQAPPINFLRMLACGQIVNFGWREGMSAEDAAPYFEEAKQIAVSMNDMRANALIHAAYGRILANGGSADEYVGKIREAEQLAVRAGDTSVLITLRSVLCHALRLSGRMSEALQVNAEALERANDIVEADRQMLGFDIKIWLTAMRGHILVALGRMDEARPLLDSVLQVDEAHIDAIHSLIPSVAYVEMGWATANPALAQQHADRALALANKSGNPYIRVYALACRGLAHVTAGRPTLAVDDFRAALQFVRSRKAGLEMEGRILADLANAQRLAGDFDAALATVEEALRVTVAQHARCSQCLAYLVRGALLASRDPASSAVDLERADALIRDTGALIFEPLLANAQTPKARATKAG
jgi:class 3 adenylate cyclase/tetratricopeptide (TPR) repeat protein